MRILHHIIFYLYIYLVLTSFIKYILYILYKKSKKVYSGTHFKNDFQLDGCVKRVEEGGSERDYTS